MIVSWYLLVSVLHFIVLSTFEPSASISNHFHAYEDAKWWKTFHSGVWDVLSTLPVFKLLGLIHSTCRNPKSEVLSSNHQPFHLSFKCYLLGIFLSTGDSNLGKFSSINYFREEFLSISGFFIHFPNMQAVLYHWLYLKRLLLPKYSLSNDVVLIAA